MEGRGNDAPVAERGKQKAAGETRRDAAQEEHLKGRKIARDQLHEAVAATNEAVAASMAATPVRLETLRMRAAL